MHCAATLSGKVRTFSTSFRNTALLVARWAAALSAGSAAEAAAGLPLLKELHHG